MPFDDDAFDMFSDLEPKDTSPIERAAALNVIKNYEKHNGKKPPQKMFAIWKDLATRAKRYSMADTFEYWSAYYRVTEKWNGKEND